MPAQLVQSWQVRPEKDWKGVAQRKLSERENRLPLEWKAKPSELPNDTVLDITRVHVLLDQLTEEELWITGLSMVALAGVIKEGKCSASTVTKAYAHRATLAQQLVNP